MNRDELRQRTKQFALDVIGLTVSLPRSREVEVIGRQLIRCATSVGANYRSACRARSRADFLSKIGVVEQEADETLYWLELLAESKLVDGNSVMKLTQEAGELVAIFTASGRTARAKGLENPKSSIRNPKSGG